MRQLFQDERAEQVQGTLALAHLMLSSLITTSAGAMVAILTFAAQAKPFPAHLRGELAWSLGAFGEALFMCLIASILGYLYQVKLTYAQETMRLYHAATYCIFLSLAGLAVGAFEGFWLVLGTVIAT